LSANIAKKLLIPYGDEVKRLFEEIAARSNFSFEALDVDLDHLHCLVKSGPRISPLAIVRKLKQEATFRLWKTYGISHHVRHIPDGPYTSIPDTCASRLLSFPEKRRLLCLEISL
jgi:REP element-mobilizing transposase RayT